MLARLCCVREARGPSNDGSSHAIKPLHNATSPGQFMTRKTFMLRFAVVLCTITLCAITLATPSFAARCGGDFNTFVAAMSAEAQAAGVSPGVTDAAFSGVTQDMAVLNLDRRRRGPHQRRPGDAVAPRLAAVADRGAVWRAAADPGRDLGAGDRFRQ